MAKSGQEVVYEGWLTKSPPTKRILRARWRRRWFSLKHSGEIPNQFILTYYADRNCRKLKGCINLDDCEQVDLGLKLDKRKLKFNHVFDIKTPTRTYYLAADSENEMRSWVTCICKVCGLKSTSDEEDLHISENNVIDNDIIYEEEKDDKNNETPPISPVSTSPYIPISECITGKTPYLTAQDFKTLQENMRNVSLKPSAAQNNQTYGIAQHTYLNYVNDMQDPRFYDCPRVLAPADQNNKKSNTSPLQSPTDTDSVFTDDDISDMNLLAAEQFTKPEAPPRPPKTTPPAPSNYMNLVGIDENGKKSIVVGPLTDDMYDFPRAHQIADAETAVRNMIQRRHYYNNAAPGNVEGHIFRYDISPKPSTSASQVFKYDEEVVGDEPASPLSQSSSTTAYSNLPSPLLADGQLMPPPIVNRELKPRRKLSDSLSSCSNPEPMSPRAAPSVDRKLKPPTPLQEARRSEHRRTDEDGRRVRAAPSPTGLGRSHESLLSSNQEEPILQYLELDHDGGPSISNAISIGTGLRSSNSNTVYKKVDFERTEAFNITRNNLEKERKEPVTFTKK